MTVGQGSVILLSEAENPERPLRRIRRPDRWYLAAALAILLGISFLSYRDWEAFQRSAPQVQHTRALLQQIQEVISSVKDAESGQRGYLLTGDSEYLDNYHAANSALPSQLNKLRALAATEPGMPTAVASLSGLIAEKLSELEETVALRRSEGFKAALAVVETNRGKHAMDDIRRIGDDLQDEVYQGLLRNIRERQQQGSNARLTTTLGAAALFVFLLMATVDIGHAAAERDRLIAALQAANNLTSASRDLLQTTLTSIGDAVITTDDAGRVMFVNRVAEQLTGWNQAEAEGQPLPTVLMIVNEQTRQPVESPAGKALREGVIVGLANHTVLIARDGSEHPIDDSAAPIRGPEGKVIGVVMVFRDVTARRRSEETLRALNEALLRTNHDLQQFAYAASHDLKEPLRTVATCLQLVRKMSSGKILDAESEHLMDVAVAGAQRMHALVEALLEYSRAGEVAESGLEPVPVDRVVGDAVINLQSAITESNASISCSALPIVAANPMISNALKYRSQEPPRIAVTASEDGPHWVFQVADNGIGIDPAYQAQIFGIFKRLHGDEYPGTGIGLAICKKIVERHWGTMWVESELQKGSRFVFTLPRTSPGANGA
jgi:PAS domain S-box-containing protein